MSKILTKSTKITEQTVPKKSAKFVVQRTQSSNTLSLLKAARVAPKACPNSIQQIHLRVSKHNQSSHVAKEQLNIIYMKMLHQRKVAMIDAGGDEQQQKAEAILTKEVQQQQQQKKQTVNNEDKNDIKMAKKGHKNALAAKKWTSALRVVSAMTRFKNVPTKHCEYDVGSRGSSFSTSNESTPSRTYAAEQPAATERKSVDPVYLALKQATAKYGSAAGCCSGGESRRGSQSLTPTGTLFDATMLSARNLSQTSLYDSGTYSENELLSARSGSTPQLHGISVHSAASRRDTSLGLLAALKGTSSPAAEASNSRAQTKNERRPKLSAQMKSVSLDCAEILPSSPPVKAKNGEIRHNYYVNKPPLRPAQAFVNGGEAPIIPAGEFEAENQRNNSPSAAFRCAAVPPVGLRRQRRLPPVPVQQQQPQMPTTDASSTKGVHVQPQVLHIVTHEYVSGDCSLRPCDRLVVVDNGDPDWKHGFKLNDQLEHLITFPNSCVASYKPEEQPMRLLQSCNLSGQKLRLYRDQVVFAQPDSLSNDGKVLVRTEYDKFAKCPLQFLTMA